MNEPKEHVIQLVFDVRGHLVMLASEVAKIFEVETRLINQNIKANNKNNPPLFPEKYAFQLTKEETDVLRSSGMISKLTRGGSRAAPWVVTRKGAIRLATIMKSPKAVKAADIFVDIFDEVISSLHQGNTQISVANSSRLLPDESSMKQFKNIREKIAHSVDELLNTVVNKEENRTVKDELGEIADDAAIYIKEWLKNKKFTNNKIQAEALLIIEKTRDIYERRKSDLATAEIERKSKSLDIIEKQIKIIERLLKMYNELEPNALVQLISGYADNQLLPDPDLSD
jgi:ORF6N domain